MNEPRIIESSGLSADEKLEYEQISQWARHDDTIIYQAASTVLPLAFGAVVVAVQFPKMAIPLALFSITLYAYWLLIATRLSWFSSIRLQRLRDLEQKSSFAHHLLLATPPDNFKHLMGSAISIRKVRWLGLVVLIAAWVVTLTQLIDVAAKAAYPALTGTSAAKPVPLQRLSETGVAEATKCSYLEPQEKP